MGGSFVAEDMPAMLQRFYINNAKTNGFKVSNKHPLKPLAFALFISAASTNVAGRSLATKMAPMAVKKDTTLPAPEMPSRQCGRKVFIESVEREDIGGSPTKIVKQDANSTKSSPAYYVLVMGATRLYLYHI